VPWYAGADGRFVVFAGIADECVMAQCRSLRDPVSRSSQP
jgi:hypothetical protein